MADASMIEPKDTTAPAPEPTTPETAPAEDEAAGQPETGAPKVPDAVLKIPAIQALFVGKPPALSAPIKEFSDRPEGKLISENKDILFQAGLGLYRSLSGDIGVLFNQMHIHPEELKAADKAGQLGKIAPPFDAINHMISKSGANHPALTTDSVPGGPKPAPMPAVPQMNSAQVGPTQSPAAAQRKALAAKVSALQPQSPTTGAQPGGGQLLNSILRPVV
jgi:hypothetical protein